MLYFFTAKHENRNSDFKIFCLTYSLKTWSMGLDILNDLEKVTSSSVPPPVQNEGDNQLQEEGIMRINLCRHGNCVQTGALRTME